MIVETYPPDYMDELGLGYAALKAVNPRLVMCSITPFGQSGPYRDFEGSDLVIQAMGGLAYCLGFPEDPPAPIGAFQSYYCASIQGAVGIMAALYLRETTGEGQQVDVSCQEAVLQALETAIQHYDMRKEIKTRIARETAIVPGIGMYECADGHIFAYIVAGFGAVITPLSGLSYITGMPGRAPVGTNTNYTDYVVNPGHLAVVLIAALRRRKRTGLGQHIVMSQLASSACVLDTTILDYTVNGRIRGPWGASSPYAAPYGCYKCKGEDRNCTYLTPLGPMPGKKNDRWCAITVITDAQWWAFCDAIGNLPWTRNPKFATVRGRKENEAELNKLVEEWTSQRSAEEVMLVLQQAGVPAGVVQDAEDLLEHDPHLRARGYYVYLHHSVAGTCAYDSLGFRLSATPGKQFLPAPRIGEHTEMVCKEVLGMSDDEISNYLVEGVIEIG